MEKSMLVLLRQIAQALAGQFGGNCEVAIHDLTADPVDSSIVIIENGRVTARRIGDGPSRIVLEALHSDPDTLSDQLGYLTRTPDGRILKSSTVYVRDAQQSLCAILAINFDITPLMLVDTAIRSITDVRKSDDPTPPTIPKNVNDLLDDLIAQSVHLVQKPVALMTKEDKINAIRYLNDHGAFLVTRSGDKISRHFGISKYTLYSYLDAAGRQA